MVALGLALLALAAILVVYALGFRNGFQLGLDGAGDAVDAAFADAGCGCALCDDEDNQDNLNDDGGMIVLVTPQQYLH